MKKAKQEFLELLVKMPDNSSLEDIQYHIYVRQKIQKGLKAAERGQVITNEEAERRMEKWLNA